jgi:hypothetical protein
LLSSLSLSSLILPLHIREKKSFYFLLQSLLLYHQSDVGKVCKTHHFGLKGAV